MGIVALVVCSFVPMRLVRKMWIVGVVMSVVLLALVFVPGIGIENYGAKRWIGFGGFSMQPSEIAKFAFVLFAAVYMSRADMSRPVCCLPVLGVGCLLCLLIIAEPNMSITVCMAAVMLAMLFIGGVKAKYFVLLLVPAVVAAPVLIFLEPYRVQRLLAFIDPWASPKGEGYQLIQSLYALGSGGFFGVGLFNSRQKFRFLPFAESDFVFAVIGEELGLVGCLLTLALLTAIVLRCVYVARHAKTRLESYVCIGVAGMIIFQVIVNVGMCLFVMPVIGLTLPFISYGGSSLVMLFAAMGLVSGAHGRAKPDWLR